MLPQIVIKLISTTFWMLFKRSAWDVRMKYRILAQHLYRKVYGDQNIDQILGDEQIFDIYTNVTNHLFYQHLFDHTNWTRFIRISYSKNICLFLIWFCLLSKWTHLNWLLLNCLHFISKIDESGNSNKIVFLMGQMEENNGNIEHMDISFVLGDLLFAPVLLIDSRKLVFGFWCYYAIKQITFINHRQIKHRLDWMEDFRMILMSR